jgi:hypothetical protein
MTPMIVMCLACSLSVFSVCILLSWKEGLELSTVAHKGTSRYNSTNRLLVEEGSRIKDNSNYDDNSFC